MAACKQAPPKVPATYFDDLQVWKDNRDARLRAPNGWVNLVGLYWLEQGDNAMGSDSSNALRFPGHAPAHIGDLVLTDSTVTIVVADGVTVLVDSIPVQEAVVYDPVQGLSAVMNTGNFEWYVIERAGNYGLRLRDLDHPLTKQPLDIPYYPWSEEWYVTATYHPFDTPRVVEIENIIGQTFEETIAGELHFNHGKQTIRLLPLMDEDGIFLMFADATSGLETYGAGRYLTAELPDSNSEVLLDFNRAYNPPCAFTPFATCPLPPEANILGIKIMAGEKDTHGHP